MYRRLPATTILVTLALACGSALPAPGTHVAGEKLDSGLGELPHYSQWVDKSGGRPFGNAVAGESLDSGLGDLPHYRHWVDKTGKDPLGKNVVRVATARR